MAKLHKWSYIIMAFLTLVLIAVTVAVSFGGDGELFSKPWIYAVFGVYFVLQLACIIFMKPALTLYRIGFYMLHIGILVMLIGFAAYIILGTRADVMVPVDYSGSYYYGVENNDGEPYIDFGFGLKITRFTTGYYEDGTPRYYGAGIAFANENAVNTDNAILEVNKTCRQNGWKIYYMSYDDGSLALPSIQAADEYSTEGGGAGITSLLVSSGKYADKDIYYFTYSNGGYTPSDGASVGKLKGLCKAKVYEGSESAVYVYVSDVKLLLLMKKDPGEYAVLAGMVMMIAGVVLMCLIRGRKSTDLPEDGAAPDNKKTQTGNKPVKSKPKGSDKP